MDCILVHFYWLLLCGTISSWNQGAKIKDKCTWRLLFKDIMDLLVQENFILSSWTCLFAYQTCTKCFTAKALVPAIIYISSFVISIIMQEISSTGKRLKAYYSAGGILWIFCGASIFLLPRSMSGFMYFISICIGIANALMTVTGISMQSVLVGSDLNGCAFVCGSLSFLDKISCGLALYTLQSYQTISPKVQNSLSTNYISVTRYGLGLVPAVCSLLGVAITYTMKLNTPHDKPLVEPLLE
uniref:Major facilitator superfamily (MFS) profile domain-containing protein n=1 Tax=Manihot esculenta TaxID=3983 RepID=A0A2C9V6B7_MANES